VDDEAAVREVATLILGEFGHTVLTAACGRDAIAMFAEAPDAVDVVLLDMTMPDMSGDEVLRELLRLRADVRVILQSGYTEHEVVERLPGATVSGFLQKPYRATALLSRVQQALR
jgi:CheY-like chemotaxis protein